MRHVLLIPFVFALLTTSVWAKRFSNQYCEFELPSGWQCALEGAEWVCQSENDDRRKEAIIILAAKKRGEQDSMEEYTAYLKKPKTYTLPGGKTQVSEAKYTKISEVNSQQWVDALHLASEVPGFYTRYLATVKEDLGVAVTFSVAKDLYSSYQGIIDNVVASLRVFRQKVDANGGGIDLASGDSNLSDTTFIPDGERPDISVKQTQAKPEGSGGTDDMLLFAGIAGVAILVFIMKKRKKK